LNVTTPTICHPSKCDHKVSLQFLRVYLLRHTFSAGNKVDRLKGSALLLSVPIDVGYGGGNNARGKALRFPPERFFMEELNPLAIFMR
jgi:hypothetical protein